MSIRIENWCLGGGNPVYQAPELMNVHIFGEVYNHPEFPQGYPVRTSYIVGIEGDKVRTVSGSLYTLGEPNSDYEENYPNARERVLNQKIA